MARKSRRNSAHGSESDGEAWKQASFLRESARDPESVQGIFRRAAATYFGKDVLEMDDEDLVDTVGEYTSIVEQMPMKNCTKGIVFAYLDHLKKKYGLTRRIRKTDGG